MEHIEDSHQYDWRIDEVLVPSLAHLKIVEEKSIGIRVEHHITGSDENCWNDISRSLH